METDKRLYQQGTAFQEGKAQFTIFKLTATDLFLTVLAQKFLNEIDFSEALLHG